LLKTFLEILTEVTDFWGAEFKTELSFSQSHTISPKSALSIISGMCNQVNEFNEEMCSNRDELGQLYTYLLKNY
jgi:ABC-type sulfate transport system substrate-binding protein